MKLALLIITVVAALTAAAPSSSAPDRILAGFQSPTGNIRCYYNPSGLTNHGPGTLTCGLLHADYAMQLQHRCEAGDWHGFTLTPRHRPSLYCPGGASGDHPTHRTLAYGASWQRGPFTCSSRRIGVTCHSRTGHGLFISRQAYRTW
jgi:uncharacterized protein DUF6636